MLLLRLLTLLRLSLLTLLRLSLLTLLRLSLLFLLRLSLLFLSLLLLGLLFLLRLSLLFLRLLLLCLLFLLRLRLLTLLRLSLLFLLRLSLLFLSQLFLLRLRLLTLLRLRLLFLLCLSLLFLSRSVLYRGQWLGDCRVLWVAAIGLGKRGFVGPGRRHVLRLDAGRSRVLVTRGYLLRGGRLVLHPAGTAAIGDVVIVDNGIILHNRLVSVGVMDDGFIDARDRSVIAEVIALPLAAGVADAPVAVAVVHATVVAHMAAPVAVMEPVVAAVPVPVVGRPKRTLIGSGNPGAGHPVVVALVLIVGPVAGYPHQVGLRAVRLFVDGQFRRSESDRDYYLRVR